MHPVSLFLFKCFIYPVALLYNLGFLVVLLVYAVLHPCTKFWRAKTRDEPPKALLDPTWGRHKFMQLKDVKLHYVENGDPSKELIVFVHGFPDFWYTWRYQLVEFSKDYWVVALDLRGFGESDKPGKMSAYKMMNAIEDIRQLVQGLGRKSFTLVGHDWGGLLVWNFLDFHSNMVDRFVILSAPHHRTWTKLIATNIRQFVASWYCFFFQLPGLPEFAMRMNDFRILETIRNAENPACGISEEDVEIYKYMFARKDALTYAIDYYRANCGELYLHDASPAAYPPGLMVFGDRDFYLSTAFLDLAKKLVPTLVTRTVEGANHFVQQDRPAETNRVLRSFLAGKLQD